MLYKPDDPSYLRINQFRDFSYFQGKKILLWSRKPLFGDTLCLFICVQILRKLGLDVTVGVRRERNYDDIISITDEKTYPYDPDLDRHPIPIWDRATIRGYEGGMDHTGARHPFDFIVDFRYNNYMPVNLIFQNLREFGVREIQYPMAGLQIKSHLRTEVDPALKDHIILCCNTGDWKKEKKYDQHLDLERLLKRNGHKVLNLTDANLSDIPIAILLMIFNSCLLLVHADSSPMHLASAVAGKKLFIKCHELWAASLGNSYGQTHVTDDKDADKIVAHIETILSQPTRLEDSDL